MRRALLITILTAAALAGCGRGPDPEALEPVADLLAELPGAAVHREPRRVELGRDGGAGAAEVATAGFQPQAAGDGYRWSLGPSSELGFFLAAPRSLPLAFRAAPFRYPGAPEQVVDVVVNGRPVASVPLAAEARVYEVELPASALRAGENRLAFRYAWAVAPREATGGRSDDPRPLAVAWEWVAFGASTDGAAAGEVRATAEELFLPWGTRVDLYLSLPPRPALRVDALAARGEGGGRLEVRVQLEGGEEAVAGTLAPAGGPRALALGEGGRLARLSLTAVPGRWPAAPAAGLVLRRPAVAVPEDGGPAEGSAGGPAAPAPATAAVEGEPPAHRRNVLVYLVDTLRADHLGAYGYGRPVSPRLDAFAADATLFETAVAQSPWTRPSVASLFTGLTPLVHGVNRTRDGLSPEAVTLAEVLSAHGWATAAMVANPTVHRRFQLGQGFDAYELLDGFDNGAPRITAWTERWLDERRDPARPFFLYLHTVEPHAPYTPLEPFRARFAPDAPRGGFGTRPHLRWLKDEKDEITPQVLGWLVDLYDAEVAANDAAFGDVLDLLARRGLLDDTVVVFVSDHGEEFMEHGDLEHAKTFYREVIEVPLVVRFPDLGRGRRVAAPVQHADVMPTLLAYLGLPAPLRLDGRDLTPWLAGEGPVPESAAAAEIHSHLDRRGYRGASVRVGGWRFVDMAAPEPSRELYDVPADAAERDDAGTRQPVRAGWLASRVRLYRHHAAAGHLTPSVETLDKELREQLRALGYI